MIHFLLFIMTAVHFLVLGKPEAAAAVRATGKRKEELSSRPGATLEPSNMLYKRSRAKAISLDLEPLP
jgi:hypothetical protein